MKVVPSSVAAPLIRSPVESAATAGSASCSDRFDAGDRSAPACPLGETITAEDTKDLIHSSVVLGYGCSQLVHGFGS